MKSIVKAPAPKAGGEAPVDEPEERRIAAGRAAVKTAKQAIERTLARAPSRPDIPAVADIPPAPDPVAALVAHAREKLEGMPHSMRERAVQALVSLLGEELCR